MTRVVLVCALALPLLGAGIDQRKPVDAKTVYVNFAINCHDWLDPDMSSEALLRAARLFAKHGIRADFYFTESLAEALEQKAPQTIRELKRLGMNFGFHQRPPHPIWFDSKERRAMLSMTPEQAYQAMSDHESKGTDLATGAVSDQNTGGFKGVIKLFGTPPAILGAGAAPPQLVAYDRDVLRRMGMKMVVAFHSQGNLDYPLLWWQGLLARPSDFSVVRVPPNSRQRANNTQVLPRGTAAGEESGGFWWNVTDDPEAQDHAPAKYLARKIKEMPNDRISFVTCLIHEDNWYKQGNSWDATFYEDRGRKQPRTPPFTPEPRKSIRLRNAEEKERIWQWWEELVALSGRHERIRNVTVSQIYALVRPDDLERTYPRQTVLDAAKIIAASKTNLPEFVVTGEDALSLSDCVQAFTKSLTSKPPAVRVMLGPIRRPSREPVSAVSLTASSVRTAAASLTAPLEQKQLPHTIPAVVRIADKDVPIETYLHAAAQVLTGNNGPIEVPALATVAPDPAQWTVKPARRAR